MTEWQEKRLADFVQINPIEKIKKGGIYKKISMEHIQPFCRDITGYEYSTFNGGSKFRNHDTVMARITPCLENGKCAQINVLNDNELGFGSTEFIVFRAITNVSDANFVYYLICSDVIRESAIKSMVGTSGRQRVQTNVLENLILSLPPLDVQKKIAGVLGALDDKIELNNKINQNLEAQAQALFKSWFIDFEPFGGKMPIDWKIGKLSDIAEYSNDTISTEFTSFENYISTENMLPNRGGISRASSLPTGNTVKSYRTTDVLISNIRPYFKKIWFALFSGGCSNDILVFRSKKDSPAFVFNVLNQDDFFEYVMSGANGSKMPRGDKKHIMQYKVIIPSAKTIKEFENIAITFLEKFSNNNQENVRLAELRDTLLPKLMNGEIDVDNVKID